jgi:hypothetical protein
VSVALKRVALCASLACLVALHASCAVEEKRSGIPAGAQSTIDSLTEDIAAGRDEKVYRDAAEEWRREVTLEEHQKMLERIRTRLGKIESRRFHRGVEQQHASGRLSGHTLDVTYETTFERGSGMEAFTLVERDARWQLASYAISSDLLQ